MKKYVLSTKNNFVFITKILNMNGHENFSSFSDKQKIKFKEIKISDSINNTISTPHFDFELNNVKHETQSTYRELKINSIPTFSKYSSINTTHGNTGSFSQDIDEQEMKLYFLQCVKKISTIGFPTMLFFLSLYLQQTMCLSFIGRKYKNQDMINAIGIVNLYINCALFCFVVGLISGLDTLLANTIGSSSKYLFGLYIHRARIITYIFSIVLCIFHYYYGLKIIRLFSIDESTLIHCEGFIVVSLFYVLFDIQFGINFRILSILDRPTICVIILILSILMHPLWCYLFINFLDKGVLGAGYALLASQSSNMIVSTLYIHFSNVMPSESYFCINKDCFLGWSDYLKFTLPSTLMLCAEWLAFEVQAVFAISISKHDYSIHIFISNIATLMYTLCHGYGMAATILIGEYIAKGMIKYSKAVALYCFLLAEITMSLLIILVMVFRENVLKIFIDDVELLEKGKPLIVILCIAEIFDSTQSVMASIYRGLGKQRVASVICFVQFYVVQIFFTWLLAIKMQMGVKGIWCSILIGNLLTTIVFCYFFTKFDFSKINLETKERLEKDQQLISQATKEEINMEEIKNGGV